MPNLKKDKKESIIDEINLETSYVNEQVANAGTVESSNKDFSVSFDIQVQDGEKYKLEYDNHIKSDFDWDALRAKYKSGSSIDEISTMLKNGILSNKNNPEYIRKFMSSFMGSIYNDLYDYDKNHTNIGNTLEEKLTAMLNTPDEESLKGCTCMNIHDFGAQLLKECGINAVVLCGKSTQSTNHATLLYQLEDGKFEYTNYSTTMTINAANIKDAAKAVYKYSDGLETYGYISFIDENGSYQEFALKDEACWGEELDKRFYNNKSMFEDTFTKKSSIDSKINYSNLGNVSAEISGTIINNNESKPTETTLSLGYKRNREGELFNNSCGTGLKFTRKGLNKRNGNYFETKAVVDYTQGEIPKCNIDLDPASKQKFEKQLDNIIEKEKDHITDVQLFKSMVFDYLDSFHKSIESYKTNHLTLFFRGIRGKEIPITDNLKNKGQASLTLGFDLASKGECACCGDARFSLEDGVELTTQHANTIFKNSVSGGVTTDLRLTDGEQKGGLQFGGKVNISSGFTTRPSNNCIFGANANASAAIQSISSDYNINGNLFCVYKPENSKSTIFGQINANFENQHLRIGNFNQQTENNTTLGVTIGTNINSNTSLNFGYNVKFDKLNPTRNKSIVTLGAKINI